MGFDYNKQCEPAGKNVRSAKQNPEVVTDYLLAECAAGRVIGPFRQDVIRPGLVQINRVGVIPKGTSGRWRLIVDLSFLQRQV